MEAVTIAENEAYLRQKSTPIDPQDPKLSEYIQILEKYCLEHEVMAMAAIQLRIPKRLVYLKNTNLDAITQLATGKAKVADYNEARVLLNPVILRREGLTEYWEACASCLTNCGRILRPYHILVAYTTPSGEKRQEDFVGFESTVLSHEMDHLDGILHMDVAKEVLQMTAPERKKFREQHPYRILSKVGDYATLCSC